MSIDRRDLDDLSIVDADELQSSGSGDIYCPYAVVLSCTGTSGQVRISGYDIIHDEDFGPVQVGDIFFFSGSIPAQPVASSSWRVESIVNSGTFTVSPSITTSVFGTGSFRYSPGAKKVGASSARFSAAVTTGSNVQQILDDLGISLGTGIITGVPPDYHSAADETQSTTSSTSLQTKLTGTFTASASGTFFFLWYIEGSMSAANKTIDMGAYLDGPQVGNFVQAIPAANQFIPFGGFFLTSLAIGAHTASLQYRVSPSSSQSPSATVQRARMGVWRVT